MTTSTVERKKLLKRLTGFLAIIGDEAEALDPALLARIHDTVAALGRPARIVVAGLEDARHHALVSLLAGAKVVPDALAATCPALVVKAGAEARTATRVGEKDRVFRGCVVDKLIAARAPGPVTLSLPDLTMPHVSMSVLPVYDSHDDRSGYLYDLLEDSDAVLWCSDAGARWQPRERRLWFTVPDDVKERSLLVMTGAERLEGDADAREAHDEKREITGGEFAGTVLLRSGESADLVAALSEMIDGEMLADARALRDEIATIPIGTVTAPPPPVPAPAPSSAPAPAPAPAASVPDAPGDDARATIAGHARACIEATAGGDEGSLFDAMTAMLDELSRLLKSERLTRDHDALAAQVDEATDLIGLLSYEGTVLAARESADLLRQIAIDMLDRLPVADASEEFREAS